MSELHDIERRLARLERQNRWLRGLLVGLGLVVVLLALPGNPATAQDDKATALKARSFVVTDERGEKRATLGLAKDGVGLVFYDAKGATEAVLGTTGEGTNLSFFEGGTRRLLVQLKDGTPLVRLFDERGKGGAALQVSKGRPALVLLADGDDSQATLAVFDSGPRLQFRHQKQGTFVVSSTKVGTRLELLHEPGKPGLQLLANANAAGLGWAQGKEERGSIVVRDRETLPSFLDGSGKPLLPRLLPKK
jgi:hypothetical protein